MISELFQAMIRPSRRVKFNYKSTGIAHSEISHHMGIRIQPAVLEIPTEHPFTNDLLGRETPAQVLTQVIRSIDGPCVLSIDGPFGSGKTTFLRLWTQHLNNQDIQVVNLNAWETDYSGDPFLALSQGILAGLENNNDNDIPERLREFGQIAGKVAVRVAPALVSLATMGALNIAPLLEAAAGAAAEQATETHIDRITAQRKSLTSFKEKLAKLVEAIAGTDQNRPLVIMIDELDRCRPSYAIEMLEVTKHLFSVDNIVFALGVNRSQLAHSVKCLYGQDFDADAYLKRFFDIDFCLPEPDKTSFINDLMKRTGIDTFFDQTSGSWANSEDRQLFGKILSTLLVRSPLTLRQISQAIHHLGLVFTSLGTRHHAYALPSAMAIILKYTIPETYNQLRHGNISDSDVVDHLFTALGIPNGSIRIRDEHSQTYAAAEAIIAACAVEASDRTHQMSLQYGPAARERRDYWSSPLITKYKYKDDISTKDAKSLDYCNHFHVVISTFRQRSSLPFPVGFLIAAERLELLSSSLLPLSYSDSAET